MVKFQRHLDIALICYSCLLTTTTGIPESKKILAEGNDSKLRLVSAVFRHGDRTIDRMSRESYPNDPHKNSNFYPIGDGHLTNAGKKRSYELGQLLKDRYNSFLGDVYYPPNVYARSTGVPRCKMTLQLVLAALYPPVDIQKWNSKLAWQPMDLIYVPPFEDDLLLPFLTPTYIEIYNDVMRSPEVIEKIAEFNDLMKTVSNHTGLNIIDIVDFLILYGTLYAESSMKLGLPEWTKDIFPDGRLLDAAVLYFRLLSYKQLNNLNGGVLLDRIIDDMDKVINGTLTDRKINLFSAHDINVASFLHALNIYERRIPAYTSSVIVELHEKSGKYFVKVLHYLGILSETREVSIPGCEVLCPYNKFLELTSRSMKVPKQPTTLSVNPKIGKFRTLLTPFNIMSKN